MSSKFGIDARMIRLTERFAQWVQKKTNKTNYFFASAALVLFVISVIGGFWWFVNGGSESYKGYLLSITNEIPPVFIYVFIFMVLVRAFWGEPIQEKMAFARLKEKIPNPMKNSVLAQLIRLAMLGILLGLVFRAFRENNAYLIYDILALSLLFIGNLLASCDPLLPTEDSQTKTAP